ncbi:ethanolamine-phosphate phospho-lyase-like [Physella acuta]|uniref:ethanolamine-phosphate phospho-lyase-like n=1 Tax=Physella acuta TaxID=109671 RepID=UPI0027DB9412|nr:ethanolamine-phosphate phospho-lyase-like [Physella acuta]
MDGTLTKTQSLELRKKYIGPSCTLFFKSDPLKIVRASGQYMYDEENNEYLDCINNVCHVGHCHPKVVEAASEQMKTLNTNSRFLHDNMLVLAQKLVATMPEGLCMVYFANSGSEANDLAIRLARHHTKATEIISLDRAYHGHVVSLIDISTYKLNNMKDGVHTKPDFVHIAECPDTYRGKYRSSDHTEEELSKLYAANVDDIITNITNKNKKVCCFIAEAMQSCGGQVIYPKDYLKKVSKSVKAAGGVCIIDEVQVGFGRVGTHMWSFSAQDMVPDIVTLGKPMGNGHPISAVITTREIAASFEACGVEYFNTYGGNPVSCAVGLAVLDVIEKENLMENARKIGALMSTKLNALKSKYPLIGEVRGVGMFWGLDLVKDNVSRKPATEEAAYVVKRLKEERILYSRDGLDENVLKFKPPMCFNEKNVETLITKLDLIFQELESQNK